jgi:hypothetical protein
MSRAVNLKMEQSAVMARCAKENVGVSAIERLPEGGTRLVCMSGEGADLIRSKLKRELIGGDVTREKHRPDKPMW